MNNKAILFLLCVSFLFTNLNAQQNKAELEIEEMMKNTTVAGLAVAVVKNNQLIYNHSFGKKDIESNTSLNNNDIFRIASISKSFTSTAIMQLIEAKKMSLDDDFSDLVGFKVRNPNFPDVPITLRMVLSHTSSINDKEGYFNLDAINPEKNKNWANCFNNYKPGTGYQYCNLNYNMTGAVIERVSGKRFDSYIKANILDPLNIYGGYCIDSLDTSKFVTLYEYKDEQFVASPAAYAHRRAELNNYQLGYSTPILSPTGGMKISANDLAKYMMMHMNYGKTNGVKIINKKSAKQMQTPLSTKENYGLALLKNSKLLEGKTLVGHTGSAYGLYSAMFFDPKEKFGIVVITNGIKPTEKDGFRAVIKNTYEILYKNLIINK